MEDVSGLQHPWRDRDTRETEHSGYWDSNNLYIDWVESHPLPSHPTAHASDVN